MRKFDMQIKNHKIGSRRFHDQAYRSLGKQCFKANTVSKIHFRDKRIDLHALNLQKNSSKIKKTTSEQCKIKYIYRITDP